MANFVHIGQAKLDQPVVETIMMCDDKHPRHSQGFEPITQQSTVQRFTHGPCRMASDL
jgi:hypothetical protein